MHLQTGRLHKVIKIRHLYNLRYNSSISEERPLFIFPPDFELLKSELIKKLYYFSARESSFMWNANTRTTEIFTGMNSTLQFIAGKFPNTWTSRFSGGRGGGADLENLWRVYCVAELLWYGILGVRYGAFERNGCFN